MSQLRYAEYFTRVATQEEHEAAVNRFADLDPGVQGYMLGCLLSDVRELVTQAIDYQNGTLDLLVTELKRVLVPGEAESEAAAPPPAPVAAAAPPAPPKPPPGDKRRKVREAAPTAALPHPEPSESADGPA